MRNIPLCIFSLFFGQWLDGSRSLFRLSGFLITGILLDTKNSPTDYFKSFYARRASEFCRFVLITVLILCWWSFPFLRPSEAHVIFEKSSPWWAYPLFLQNFLIAVPTLAAGPLGVSWSLAIEEQFYLAWSILVRLLSPAALKRIAVSTLFFLPRWDFTYPPIIS